MTGATVADHALVFGLVERRGRFHLRSMLTRLILATFAAGIAGTLANALAAALLDPELIRLAVEPGRYAVAVLVAFAIPLSLAFLRSALAPWVALMALTLLPSLLAKFLFGAGAAWSLVLSLNAVYALAALLFYRLAGGGWRVRRSKRI